jgi:hypothetical protein
MLRFFIESKKKPTGNFIVDLHAIKHTKPFALKVCESLVVEQNVHTEQNELLERRCRITITSATCASTFSLFATQRIFSSPTILNLYLLLNKKLMNPKAQDKSTS